MLQTPVSSIMAMRKGTMTWFAMLTTDKVVADKVVAVRAVVNPRQAIWVRYECESSCSISRLWSWRGDGGLVL